MPGSSLGPGRWWWGLAGAIGGLCLIVGVCDIGLKRSNVNAQLMELTARKCAGIGQPAGLGAWCDKSIYLVGQSTGHNGC